MKTFKILVMLTASALLLMGCAGHKGDQGDQGYTGPSGTNGHDGSNGRDGADGQDGAPGSNGNTGPAGADGQIAQVVQLCPGVTIYPSAFVEVALKINGELYAVYSLNNGFLTRLPPGNYSSNAVGSACNFTVNADRTVSH